MNITCKCVEAISSVAMRNDDDDDDDGRLGGLNVNEEVF